jgi:plasmid stabilization system protein ParE
LPVTFRVVFTQAARAELIDAQDWYEGQVSGLGRRFRHPVDVLAERMSANPRQFPIVFKNVRRALFRCFPYALLFVFEDETLLVIACFHASRDPWQWQKRT